MYVGLVISCVLHLALLGLALVSIQTTQPITPPEPEAVAVALISPDDLTRLMQGDRSAKAPASSAPEGPSTPPQPKEAVKSPPTPPPTQVANTPPPPPAPKEPAADEIAQKLAALAIEPPTPPPAKVEPPPPKASDDDKQKLIETLALEQKRAEAAKEEAEAKAKTEADARAKAEAESKAKKEAEAKKEADAKAVRDKAAKEKAAREKAAREKLARDKAAREKAERDAAAKKPAFDPSKLANDIQNDTTPQALQNKAPPKGGPVTTAKSDPAATTKAPNAGDPTGRDSANTASLAAAVRAKILQQLTTCWNINAGLDGANRIVPKIYFELNRDGSLRGQPRVENPQGTAEFNNAAEAALRAVVDCAQQRKFADLPPEYYPYWERSRIDFNPQAMFR